MNYKNAGKLDIFLLNYSKIIDDIDMYLGPFADAAQLSSSEIMQKVGIGIDLGHLLLLKFPFISLYLMHTRNFSALMNWIPRELLSFGLPYGGLIEIQRNYEQTCHNYYNQNYNLRKKK